MPPGSTQIVEMACERMKKADLYAQECQVEFDEVRVGNSEASHR